MTDYKAFLTRLHNDLNALRERQAKQAGNTSLSLLNQIEDYERAIALTGQARPKCPRETCIGASGNSGSLI